MQKFTELDSLDYETCKQEIENLSAEFGGQSTENWNEAKTRFLIIDRVIEKCLGWSRGSVDPERYHSGDYSDYELGLDGSAVVVEAKREGKSFELPAGFSKSKAKIKTLKEISKDLAEAIDQVLKYAKDRSIPICVVSNGKQLIAFLGSRTDGIPPDEGDAMVFPSLEAMVYGFHDLWNCLSPPGVKEMIISKFLAKNSTPPPPPKLSSKVINYPGYKNRNEQASELQILGDLFLEDIVRSPEIEEEFLREAYCESGALSQYALVSKSILNARYSAAFDEAANVDSEPLQRKGRLSPTFSKDVLSASLNRRPILLVGDVGAGKTTFIRHLIKIQAKDILADSIVLYIDFGSQPVLSDQLNQFVIAEIDRQLVDLYGIDIQEDNFIRGVHHSGLQRFSKGIYSRLKESDRSEYDAKEIDYLLELVSDKESHLKASIEHLVKARKKQVVISLDNVDQRPAPFQEQAFLVSQSIAEKWPVTVFVSLRPETFNLSKVAGVLAAYHPKVFTISPPRVDHVLVKRISFAVKLLKDTGRLPWFPEGLTIRSSSLLGYMDMLLYAFRNVEPVIELVDNLSGGNVRRALDFVSSFVGSGHVDSAKILRIINEQGRYNLPLHEFLRAIIYGDHKNYNPTDSLVSNIMDVSSPDKKEHFAVAIVVSFILRKGKVGGADGYVDRADAVECLQYLGFQPVQIDNTLNRALAANLIATPQGPTKLKLNERYRGTSIGAYSVDRLVCLFSYIDAIIVDTPVMDETLRNRLVDTDQLPLVNRLERAGAFVDYLDNAWSSLHEDSVKVFDWPARSAVLKEEIQRLR